VTDTPTQMSDSESSSLVTQTTPGAQQPGGGGGRKKPPPPDWGKFGLSQEPVKTANSNRDTTGLDDGYQHTDASNKNELFQEDMVSE